MTCIAAITNENGSFIAGERSASQDDCMMLLSTPKVWKSGEYLLGYYGGMEGLRVKENFIPPKIPTGANVEKFMTGVFVKALYDFYQDNFIQVNTEDCEYGLVIVVQGKIFEHDTSDMSMMSFQDNYFAMGSGGSYALGSLHSTQSWKDSKKRLTTALEAAIKYSSSCQGNIDIVSL
jgi:ATP-dependent protease HslVU (ClpYQ) peptidase subunit